MITGNMVFSNLTLSRADDIIVSVFNGFCENYIFPISGFITLKIDYSNDKPVNRFNKKEFNQQANWFQLFAVSCIENKIGFDKEHDITCCYSEINEETKEVTYLITYKIY